MPAIEPREEDDEPAAIRDLLSLASVYHTTAQVEAWSGPQRKEAADWAAACVAAASGCEIEVGRRPRHVAAPLSREPGWWRDETEAVPAPQRKRVGSAVAKHSSAEGGWVSRCPELLTHATGQPAERWSTRTRRSKL